NRVTGVKFGQVGAVCAGVDLGDFGMHGWIPFSVFIRSACVLRDVKIGNPWSRQVWGEMIGNNSKTDNFFGREKRKTPPRQKRGTGFFWFGVPASGEKPERVRRLL